jgi:hypothetical protein
MTLENRSAENVTIKKNKVILCEGIDEIHFFTALLKNINISNVQVVEYGGKTRLKTYLKTFQTIPGFQMVESLVITRDADTRLEEAFQSVCDALKYSNYQIPSRPQSFEFYQGKPKIGVFIIGSDPSHKKLEDLCLDSIKDDKAFPCIDSYFDCLEEVNCMPQDMSKAQIHAFLASRDIQKYSLGVAAEKGYWDFKHPVFKDLINFLRKV